MNFTSRITMSLLSSMAATCMGINVLATADPAPEGTNQLQSSCNALAGATPDTINALNKLHDLGPTISPALPHPDNPELETGQVNILQLFLQARDIAGSLHQGGASLRNANNRVEIEELRNPAEALAQAEEETAVEFDSASNILGPRPSMDDAASVIFDHISSTMNAFHSFNDSYLHHCDADLRPEWDFPVQDAESEAPEGTDIPE